MQAMLDNVVQYLENAKTVDIKQVISKVKVSAKHSLTDSLIRKYHYTFFILSRRGKLAPSLSILQHCQTSGACLVLVCTSSVFVHHHLPFYTHPQQAAIVSAIFIPIIMSTQT